MSLISKGFDGLHISTCFQMKLRKVNGRLVLLGYGATGDVKGVYECFPLVNNYNLGKSPDTNVTIRSCFFLNVNKALMSFHHYHHDNIAIIKCWEIARSRRSYT